MNRIPALVLALLLAPAPLLAQPDHLPSDRGYVGVEVMKPIFTSDTDSDFATLVAYASLRYPVSEHVGFTAGIPFSRWDPSSGGESETAIGNIYLGLEGLDLARNYGWDFGLSLPTAPSDNFSALLVGSISDLERWEAFFPDVFSISGGVSYWALNQDDVGIRFRIAPSLMIPTEGGDPEVFGTYSGHFVYLGPKAEFSAGFLGRAILTEEDFDFSERTMHQMELSATLLSESFRPGLHVRVPMDDGLFRDFVDVVIGVHVGGALR